jgi:hypothetical protein
VYHLAQFFFVGSLLALPLLSPEQPLSPAQPVDSSSLSASAAALRENFKRLSSPELERRKAVRRSIQQRGYVSVLRDVVAGDGIGALLAFLRLHAQLEFHLPNNILFVYARVPERAHSAWEQRIPGTSGVPSAPVAIPLYEDLTFPVDPWHKAK